MRGLLLGAAALATVSSHDDPCKIHTCRCDLKRMSGTETTVEDLLKLQEPIILTGLTDSWTGALVSVRVCA